MHPGINLLRVSALGVTTRKSHLPPVVARAPHPPLSVVSSRLPGGVPRSVPGFFPPAAGISQLLIRQGAPHGYPRLQVLTLSRTPASACQPGG